MPDSFIVTIMLDNNQQLDVEIPAHVDIAALKERLTELICHFAPRQLSPQTSFRLLFNGRCLPDNETPAQAGAFDGSVLQLVKA